jgi:hypothetical protein
MSHFTRVGTSLRDSRLIVQALNAVGLDPVEHHDRPVPLYGYGGQERQAEVIVRREVAARTVRATPYADLGFARGRSEDSYSLIVDGDDRRRWFDEQWQRLLTQEYGRAAALQFARESGFEVHTDLREENGVHRLVLTRAV